MTLEEKVYQLCAVYFGSGDEIFQDSGVITEKLVADQLGDHNVGSISAPTVKLDPAKSVEAVNDLQRYAREKTRLGIPVLVNNEGLHGLVMKGATCFPQAIGLAATFNPGLIGQIGEAIGDEAQSRGVKQLLTPVLDLGREPRHGRVEE
jgi:beta-glucosidase